MFVCLYVWKYAEHPLVVWLNTDLFIIENKSLVWAEEEAEDPRRVRGMGWVFHNSGVFTGSFFPHHTSVFSAFLCFSVLFASLQSLTPSCFPIASFFAFLQSLSVRPPISFTSVYFPLPPYLHTYTTHAVSFLFTQFSSFCLSLLSHGRSGCMKKDIIS